MHFKTLCLLLAVAFLASCASNPTFPLARPSSQQQAEIVVYRESSFIAGGVALTVGANGKAIANLSNTEKVRVLLAAGEHEIYVQARSANPTKVRVQLQPGASLRLRTSSSPSTLAKIVVPITLVVTGYYFYLDQTDCPKLADLDKYKDVPVAYQ